MMSMRMTMTQLMKLPPRISNKTLLCPCKRGDELGAPVTNVGERRSSAMGNNPAHIVRSIAMVRISILENYTTVAPGPLTTYTWLTFHRMHV